MPIEFIVFPPLGFAIGWFRRWEYLPPFMSVSSVLIFLAGAIMWVEGIPLTVLLVETFVCGVSFCIPLDVGHKLGLTFNPDKGRRK